MAIKIKGSTIINDDRSGVGIGSFQITNGDPINASLNALVPWGKGPDTYGLAFKPDGTRVSWIQNSDSSIRTGILTTAWDLTSITNGAGVVGSYDAVSFDGLGASSGHGLRFGNNGKYIYTIDEQTNSIHRWNLLDPYNPSGSYTSSGISTFPGDYFDTIGVNGANGSGFDIKYDGTQLYVLHRNNDTLYTYDILTPWDITTLQFNNALSLDSGTSIPNDIKFSSDGYEFLLCNDGPDDIDRYFLTIPWDTTTATYDQAVIGIKTDSGLGNSASPHAIDWSVDRKNIYVFDDSGNNILHYTVPQTGTLNVTAVSNFYDDVNFDGDVEINGDTTTRGDLSVEGTLTIGDDNPGASISINGLSDFTNITRLTDIADAYVDNCNYYRFGGDADSTGITAVGSPFIKPDGTKMWLVGDGSNNVVEYELSTPGSVGTASSTGITTQTSGAILYATSITFSRSGDKFFVVGYDPDIVEEYTMDVAWDIRTAGFTTSILLDGDAEGGVEGTPSVSTLKDINFSRDGYRMFVSDESGDGAASYNVRIFDYELASPFSIDTVIGFGSAWYSSDVSLFGGIAVGNGGTSFYVSESNKIHQYYLTTPYDIRTAKRQVGFANSLTTSPTSSNNIDIQFKPDGTQLYILDNVTYDITTWDLSTPWDVHTGTASTALDTNAYVGETAPRAFRFSADGYQLYFTGDTFGNIYQYTMTVPWDIGPGNISFASSISRHDLGLAYIKQIGLSTDGTKLYTSGNNGSAVIVQSGLSTAWNIGSASSTSTGYYFGNLGQLTNFNQWSITDDGNHLYFASNNGPSGSPSINYDDYVYHAEFGTTNDITTLTYNGREIFLGQYTLHSTNRSIDGAFTFNSDGTKILYVVERTEDGALVYVFNCDTPYKISSADLYKTASLPNYLGTRDRDVTGISINESETKLYVTRNGGSDYDDIIEEYDIIGDYDKIVNPPDINVLFLDANKVPTALLGDDSGNFERSQNASAYNANTGSEYSAFHITLDGKYVYTSAEDDYKIRRYILEEPWNLRTARTSDGDILDTLSTANWVTTLNYQESDVTGLYVSPDGHHLYFCGYQYDNIIHLYLNVPHDLTSVTHLPTLNENRVFALDNYTTDPSDINFTSDGRYLLLSGGNGAGGHYIWQFELSTPWNLDTAVLINTLDVQNLYSEIGGTVNKTDAVGMSDDGKFLHFTTRTSRLFSCILTIPYDISSASSVQYLNLEHGGNGGKAELISDSSSVSAGRVCVRFKPDRSSFFLLHSTDRVIREYRLTQEKTSLEITSTLDVYGDLNVVNNIKTATLESEFANISKLGIGTDVIRNDQDLVSTRFADLPSIGSRPVLSNTKVDADIFFPAIYSPETVSPDNGENNRVKIRWRTNSRGISEGNYFYLNQPSAGIRDEVYCNHAIVEYKCEKEWDIKTARPTGKRLFASLESNRDRLNADVWLESFAFSVDGKKVYLGFLDYTESGYRSSWIVQVDLLKAWDITSTTNGLQGPVLDTTYIGGPELHYSNASNDTYKTLSYVKIKSLAFSKDGDKLFVLKSDTTQMGTSASDLYGSGKEDKLYQFNLSTPWDISSASLETLIQGDTETQTDGILGLSFPYISSRTGGIQDIQFTPDGSELILCRNRWSLDIETYGPAQSGGTTQTNSYHFWSYKLSTPYDLSSVKDDHSVAFIEGCPWIKSFVFADEGKSIISVTSSEGTLHNHLSVRKIYLEKPYNVRTSMHPEGISSIVNLGLERISKFKWHNNGRVITLSETGNYDGAKFPIDSIHLYHLEKPYNLEEISRINGFSPAQYIDGFNQIKPTVGRVSRTSLNTYGYITDYHITQDGMNLYTIGWDRSFTIPVQYRLQHYRLLNAWDLESGSLYSESNILNGSQITGSNNVPVSLDWSDDGTQLLVLFESHTDDQQSFVVPFVLDTPWDLSTIRRKDSALFVSSNAINVYDSTAGIGFGTDGRTLMVSSNSNLYQYRTLNENIPYDVRYMTHESVVSLTFTDANETIDFFMHPDGSKIWELGYGDDRLYEKQLEIRGDVRTSIASTSYYLQNETSDAGGMTFSTDGRILFITDFTTDEIFRFDLIEPFNTATENFADYNGLTGFTTSIKLLATGVTATNSNEIEGEFNTDGNLRHIRFNPDGTKMFVLHNNIDSGDRQEENELITYYLDEPWNLQTAKWHDTFGLSHLGRLSAAFTFNPDGTRLYVAVMPLTNTYESKRVIQYELSKPWDISTAFYKPEFLILNPNDPNPNQKPCEFILSPDGYSFYYTERNYNSARYNFEIYQWNMKTPYDVSTASFGSVYEYDYPTVSSVSYESSPNFIGFDIDFNNHKLYRLLTSQSSDTEDNYAFQLVRFSLDSKPTILSQGIDVIGNIRSKGDLIVEGNAEFVNIGIGTIASDRARLRVTDSEIDVRSVNSGFDISNLQVPMKDKLYLIDGFGTNSGNAEIGDNIEPIDSTIPTGGNFKFSVDGTNLYVVTGNQTIFFNRAIKQYHLSNPWEIETAKYMQSFAILFNGDATSSTDNFYDSIYDIEFKPDGTRFYVNNELGTGAVTNIAQYDLDVPWDISTAAISGIGTGTIINSAEAQNIRFVPDGTSFIVQVQRGNSNPQFYQYYLDTPWDITTIDYSRSKDSSQYSNENTLGHSFYVRPDGRKWYEFYNYQGGSAVAIIEFTSYRPWDISGIRLDNEQGNSTTTNWKLLRIARQGERLLGLTFSPDGFNMYYNQNNIIYQARMSEAWNLKTLTFSDPNRHDWDFEKTTYESNFGGLTAANDTYFDLSDDGRNLYVANEHGQIYQYYLETPWDFQNAQFVDGTQALTLFRNRDDDYDFLDSFAKIKISSDGRKMYVLARHFYGYLHIIEAILDVPYQIYSIRHSYTLPTEFIAAAPGSADTRTDFDMSEDGRYLYLSPASSFSFIDAKPEIYQIELETPWDLSTWRIIGDYYPLVSPAEYEWGTAIDTDNTNYQYGHRAYGIKVKPDGTRLYWSDRISGVIYEEHLGLDGDLYRPSKVGSVSVDYEPISFAFKSDGTKFYVTSGTDRHVYQYSLNTPWEISTHTGIETSFSTSTPGPNIDAYDIEFNDGGTRMYIAPFNSGSPVGAFYEFELTTPWDVSTAVGTPYTFAPKNLNNPASSYRAGCNIRFSSDGLTVYWTTLNDYTGNSNDYCATEINSARLTTPFEFRSIVDHEEDELGPKGTWRLSDWGLIHIRDSSRTLGIGLGFDFNQDGTRLFVVDTDWMNGSKVWKFTLKKPWDLSSAVLEKPGKFYQSAKTSYSGAADGQLQDINSFTLSRDGFYLYLITQASLASTVMTILEYKLSKPWEIHTARSTGRQIISDRYIFDRYAENNATRTCIKLSPSGKEFYYLITNSGYSGFKKFDIPTEDLNIFNPKVHGTMEVDNTNIKYGKVQNLDVEYGLTVGNVNQNASQKSLIVHGKSEIRNQGYAAPENTLQYLKRKENSGTAMEGYENAYVESRSYLQNFGYLGYPSDTWWATRFRPDGKQAFILRAQSGGFNAVETYDTSDGSIPDSRDNSSYKYSKVYGSGNSKGFDISGDGRKWYFTSEAVGTTNNLYEFTCDIPWDIASSGCGLGTGDYAPAVSGTGRTQFDIGYLASVGGGTTEGDYTFHYPRINKNSTVVQPGTRLYTYQAIDNYNAGNKRFFRFDFNEAYNLSAGVSIGSSCEFNGSYSSENFGSFWISPDETEIVAVGVQTNTNGRHSQIYRYTMSAAGDLSTISLTNQYDVPHLKNIYPTDIDFLDDGYKVVITYEDETGSTDAARYNIRHGGYNIYDLTTPYDISTMKVGVSGAISLNHTPPYNNIWSFSFGANTEGRYGHWIDQSGTRMFVQKTHYYDVDTILYCFKLDVPWLMESENVTYLKTVSIPASEHNNVSTQSIYFSPDGRKFYTHSNRGCITQWDLETPWELSSRTNVYSQYSTSQADPWPFVTGTNNYNKTNLEFSPDGKTMVVVREGSLTNMDENAGGRTWINTDFPYGGVHTFKLRTAWDIRTLIDPKEWLNPGNSNIPGTKTNNNIAWGDDGQKLYIVHDQNIYLTEMNGHPYDLRYVGTATTTGFSAGTVGLVTTLPYGGRIKTLEWKGISGYGTTTSPQGTIAYVLNTETNNAGISTLIQLTCSTPWDMSTATETASVDLHRSMDSMRFMGDGSSIFFYSNTDDSTIYQYSLPTNWDITSIDTNTYSNITGKLRIGENSSTTMSQIEIDPEGRYLYIPIELGATSNAVLISDRMKIITYEMMVPGVLSSAKFMSHFRHNINNKLWYGAARINGIRFKPDGTQFTIHGGNASYNDEPLLVTWKCREPWNMKTAYLPGELSIGFGGLEYPVAAYGFSALRFNSDGSKAYFLGTTSPGSILTEMNLNTPYDITDGYFVKYSKNTPRDIANSATTQYSYFIEWKSAYVHNFIMNPNDKSLYVYRFGGGNALNEQGWVQYDIEDPNSPRSDYRIGADVNISGTLSAPFGNFAAGFGIVPSGGIVMWSGAINAIPTGYQICNGTNGTPDLRDRFIVGAGSAYSIGDTGGSDTVTLTESQLPAHTHRFSRVDEAVETGGAIVMDAPTAGTGFSPETIGNGDSHENRPPYYALAYIMRMI